VAYCKNCGNKGIFLSVNRDGLCKSCEPIVVNDIQQHARIINDSMKLVEESKNIKTKLSRCDLLIQHAKRIQEYENRGIPTIDPLPSELVDEYTSERDQIIVIGLKEEVKKALAKADLAVTITSKINNANKALLQIQEYKPELINPDLINDLENKVKKYVQEIQLQSYLENAKKAEFKGNVKKAIDQYQEALYFLKNDDIDDSLQKEQISTIENKIFKLQKSA
jgi:hypothetical protein